MTTTADNCPACRELSHKKHMGKFPVFTGIIIALIPKCPFCILAYTSAVSVCGSAQLSQHSPVWTSWISGLLALLTLAFVALNYKGKKTLLALAIILAGTGLIFWSELQSGALTQYQWGASLLILGVWLNGSFLYFMRKVKNLIQNLTHKYMTQP